jgi:Core-2/I-Branching enzyme
MPNYLKIKPAAPENPIAPARDLANIPINEMAILYIMLVHNNSRFVERIINSLNEPQHTFIIHVDLKATVVRTELISTAALKPNVFLVEVKDSQRVNWGGYSAVNATIQGMKYAIKLGRPFHYMQLLSGTSYPIKSNLAIRTELAQQPGAIYMDVFEEPSVPHETVWFHYVECDDRLHRINKLSIIRGKTTLP